MWLAQHILVLKIDTVLRGVIGAVTGKKAYCIGRGCGGITAAGDGGSTCRVHPTSPAELD